MKIEDFHLLKIIWCVLGLVLPIRSNCNFPKEWSGKWFQSGMEIAMEVNTTHFGIKGICLEMDQPRFLVEDRNQNCYSCVVIHEKHPNVLQYKETFCVGHRETLDSLCERITGDALLFSMFRKDAKPIQCPFKGGPPFTFTYNRGSGECTSPVSKSDSCTDDSRMLLRYQACPDVHNSESTVEELTCLAWWRDDSIRYMVGKLEHKMTSTDEDRYRCFVWSTPDNRVYNVAQSGDATCNGLPSATEGSRTMKLTQADSSHHQSADCKFPHWITEHHTWHLLDHSKTYHFSAHNGTLRVTSTVDGGTVLEMRAVCNMILASSDSHVIISAHITIGCESGYRCMSFYRRDGHVIEIQQSNKEVQIADEACTSQNFNQQTLPFITLVTPLPKRRRCPFLGQYTVSNTNDLWKMAASTDQIRGNLKEEKVPCENEKQILSLGCNDAETMEFKSECNSDVTATYSCHGYWMDGNGTSYLIALPQLALPQSHTPSTKDKYCFVIYNVPDSSSTSDGSHRPRHLQLYSLTKSCRPDLHIENGDPYKMFNITHRADCDGLSPNGAHPLQQSHISVVLSLAVVTAISALLMKHISR